jgi:UDP-N-acetylglucosamine acyltransferase
VNIHPSSIISKEAELDKDITIGPFCVVKGNVKIGKGTKIESHTMIGSDHGVVVIGENNQIFSGAMVGGPPQDLKYAGEPTRLEIGNNNVIREFATLNIGTATGGGTTKVGNNNLLMAYVHIAHDCQLGNDIAIANATHLAGHVSIEDNVRVGGVCAFNQFVRVGKFAYIAGDSAVNKDILPFSIAQGKYALVRATNKIGLERSGFSKGEVESIHRAIRILTMGSDTVEEALEEISKRCEPSKHIEYLVQFVKSSERGFAR